MANGVGPVTEKIAAEMGINPHTLYKLHSLLPLSIRYQDGKKNVLRYDDEVIKYLEWARKMRRKYPLDADLKRSLADKVKRERNKLKEKSNDVVSYQMPIKSKLAWDSLMNLISSAVWYGVERDIWILYGYPVAWREEQYIDINPCHPEVLRLLDGQVGLSLHLKEWGREGLIIKSGDGHHLKCQRREKDGKRRWVVRVPNELKIDNQSVNTPKLEDEVDKFQEIIDLDRPKGYALYSDNDFIDANPILNFLHDLELSKEEFAKKSNTSIYTMRQVELGCLDSLPYSWMKIFTDNGYIFDEVRKDYSRWKKELEYRKIIKVSGKPSQELADKVNRLNEIIDKNQAKEKDMADRIALLENSLDQLLKTIQSANEQKVIEPSGRFGFKIGRWTF